MVAPGRFMGLLQAKKRRQSGSRNLHLLMFGQSKPHQLTFGPSRQPQSISGRRSDIYITLDSDNPTRHPTELQREVTFCHANSYDAAWQTMTFSR